MGNVIDGQSRLHPLHTVKFVADQLASTGKFPGARGTGRTTAAMLAMISECIKNPYKAHAYIDHAWIDLRDTTRLVEWCSGELKRLIAKLGLREFWIAVELGSYFEDWSDSVRPGCVYLSFGKPDPVLFKPHLQWRELVQSR